MNYTITVAQVDDEPMLCSNAMALLFDVRAEEIGTLPVVDGQFRIPREWVQRARRRAREAMAHTGSDFILDALRYWARRDHDSELEVIYR